MRLNLIGICAFGVLLAGGCATSGGDRSYDPVDPWEGANRRVFAVNDALDSAIIKPVAVGYKNHVPQPVQTGIGNFFDNIDLPLTIVNQFLQGKPGAGFSDTGRLLVNTTIGIGGFFDVASKMGFAKHTEDFGQTFGVWGAGAGPHLIIPLRGSSTVRDTIGLVFNGFLSPIRLLSPTEAQAATYAMYALDARVGLLAAEELVGEAGDKYLFLRDAYLQRREFLVNDGEVAEEDPFLDDEDW